MGHAKITSRQRRQLHRMAREHAFQAWCRERDDEAAMILARPVPEIPPPMDEKEMEYALLRVWARLWHRSGELTRRSLYSLRHIHDGKPEPF